MKNYKSGDIVKHRSGRIGIFIGYTMDRIRPIQGNLITVLCREPGFGFNKFHKGLWEDENCIITGNTYNLIPEIGDYVFFIPKKKILKIDKFFYNTKPIIMPDGTTQQRYFIQEISYMILKEFYWDPNTPATMNDCVLLKFKDELVTVVNEICI